MVNVVYKSGDSGPVLSYTRSMLEDSGEWRMMGDYAIWSGARKADQSPHLLHELVGNRVLPVPIARERAIVHPIKGGTWFEVRHLFGFWLCCDVDTVWIDAPGEDGAHYYSLCVGGADARPGKVSYGWVCPACGSLFNESQFDTSTTPFESVVEQSLDAVRAFNSDTTSRTCSACGHTHPVTYGFFRSRDSSEETLARESV